MTMTGEKVCALCDRPVGRHPFDDCLLYKDKPASVLPSDPTEEQKGRALTAQEAEAMEAARNGPAAMLLQVNDAWHACEAMFRAGLAVRASDAPPNEEGQEWTLRPDAALCTVFVEGPTPSGPVRVVPAPSNVRERELALAVTFYQQVMEREAGARGKAEARVRQLEDALREAETARDGLGVRLNDAERDRERAEVALRELVRLKEVKNEPRTHQQDLEYEVAKEDAWQVARSALSSSPHPPGDKA